MKSKDEGGRMKAEGKSKNKLEIPRNLASVNRFSLHPSYFILHPCSSSFRLHPSSLFLVGVSIPQAGDNFRFERFHDPCVCCLLVIVTLQVQRAVHHQMGVVRLRILALVPGFTLNYRNA